MRYQPEGYDERGAVQPSGVAVRLAEPEDGPSPRQLALVYLYAAGLSDHLREHGVGTGAVALPGTPEEMSAALNAVITAAGPSLVWSPPVSVEGDVPDEVLDTVRQVVDRLRDKGLAPAGDVHIVEEERHPGFAHRPDGDPAPEHDGNEKQAQREREGRDRYLRLASTVYEGLGRIYDAVANEAEDQDRVVLEATRVMAGAIGEGRLVAAVDERLRDYHLRSPSDAALRDQAERLARAMLDRQLETGEASVGWDDRSTSRERRIATAELILRTDRVGAAVGNAVESPRWADGVTGALMAEGAFPPATASRIALTAREVLRTRPDWYTHTTVSEAATAAGAS